MTTLSTVTTGPDPVMQDLGERLADLQDEKKLSYKDIERAIWDLEIGVTPTHETVRSYHKGQGTAARANLAIVGAICYVYGVKVSDVSEALAERADRLAQVLLHVSASSCNSRCYSNRAGQALSMEAA